MKADIIGLQTQFMPEWEQSVESLTQWGNQKQQQSQVTLKMTDL